MPRNSYEPQKNEYIEQFNASLAGIARSFCVRENACNNPEHFTNYLIYNAIYEGQSGLNRTFALVQYNEQNEPVCIKGFITLKASSLIQQIENSWDGKPAIEITELAVHKDFENQGIGKALYDYAIYSCREVCQYVGVMYLLVCAEPNAVGYYKNILEFQEASDYYDIPREHWNTTCVPMYKRLPTMDYTEKTFDQDDDIND